MKLNFHDRTKEELQGMIINGQFIRDTFIYNIFVEITNGDFSKLKNYNFEKLLGERYYKFITEELDKEHDDMCYCYYHWRAEQNSKFKV